MAFRHDIRVAKPAVIDEAPLAVEDETASGITVSLNACDSFSAGGYTTDTVDDACSGTLPY